MNYDSLKLIFMRCKFPIILVFLFIACSCVIPLFSLEKNDQLTDKEEIPPLKNKSICVLDPTFCLESQITRENTIYEIRDIFDLKGKTVVIPEGCCLTFYGGGVYNGTLQGSNTRIESHNGRIFGNKLKLSGTLLSDVIKVSWWATLGSVDNTAEVQAALNSISSFVNRIFVFDIPIRITDLSYSLKYSPGTSFIGVSNSHQNNCAITVYGKDSQGLDISGTEILQFSNLLFVGDEKAPPRSLIFASRLVDNKQTNKHSLRNISFRGEVSMAFVYNYGGEEWTLENCEFNYSGKERPVALLYATSVNSAGCLSKFEKTEQKITSVTYTTLNQSHFVNYSSSPSIYFESEPNKNGSVFTIASIYFNQCYFNTPRASSVRFKNVAGSISFINNIDESGSVDSSKRRSPFYSFEGEMAIDGLVFLNNTMYAKKQTMIVDACPLVNKYFASSNNIMNNGAIWSFTQMKEGTHQGLSNTEQFIVTKSAEEVKVQTLEENHANIFINIGNGK